MSGRFCTSCGHENPVGSRFCSSCGFQLVSDADQRTQGMDPLVPGSAVGNDDITSAATEPAPAMPVLGWLVVTGGHRSGARFAIRGEIVTAGRHPDSDIFLDDITVSRRHVDIRATDAGLTIADVGSLNGTYLNGERIDDAPLVDGDEVQIGKFKLSFSAEAP